MNRTYLWIYVIALGVLSVGVSPAEKMTMDAAMDYAREHSPELAELRIGHASQQLETLIERAAFDLGLSADQSHNIEGDNGSASASLRKKIVGDLDLSARASLAYDEKDTESYSLRISKVILGGGSVRASRLGINNSILDEAIELNTANRYERELGYRIKEIYSRIIRNLQALQITEMKLARARENLKHALVRGRPLDIATARIEVPENEAAVLQARQSIESSYDDLKKLIGMDLQVPLEIDTAFVYRKQPVDAAAGIARCLENDEEVLNERLSRQKAENNVHSRKVTTRPELSLTGGATRDDGEDVDEGTEYTLGVSLAWNLGRRAERAAYRIAMNALSVRDVALRELRLSKAKRIRGLARRIDESAGLVDLQQDRVDLGTQLAEIYRDSWENGEIDILEYVRSQNDLENSKIRLLNLQSLYMALIAEYEFVIGGPAADDDADEPSAEE